MPDAKVYLFGSRVHDDQKGGDIDILVIREKELTGQDERGVKIAFYKKNWGTKNILLHKLKCFSMRLNLE